MEQRRGFVTRLAGALTMALVLILMLAVAGPVRADITAISPAAVSVTGGQFATVTVSLSGANTCLGALASSSLVVVTLSNVCNTGSGPWTSVATISPDYDTPAGSYTVTFTETPQSYGGSSDVATLPVTVIQAPPTTTTTTTPPTTGPATTPDSSVPTTTTTPEGPTADDDPLLAAPPIGPTTGSSAPPAHPDVPDRESAPATPSPFVQALGARLPLPDDGAAVQALSLRGLAEAIPRTLRDLVVSPFVIIGVITGAIRDTGAATIWPLVIVIPLIIDWRAMQRRFRSAARLRAT